MNDRRKPSALPVPMAHMVDQRAPAHVHELWLELERRRGLRQPTSRRRARTWLALAACFGLLLGSSLALSGGLRAPFVEDRPLLTASGQVLPTRMHTRAPHQAFDLSDGSRITLVRGAELDVLESSPRTVALALRAGRARFDVRPRGPRAWRIDCGGFAVEVVGTKFVLDRRPEGLRVDVLHGAVLVRGEGIPDGVQRLNAGQSLRAPAPVARPVASAPAVSAQPVVSPLPRSDEAEAQAEAEAEGLEVASASELSAPEVPARRRPRASPDSARSAEGAQAEPPASDSVEALFRAADQARLDGRVNDAEQALRRILERHADDSRAALAGFALGRLQLTALGRPDLAAQHFRLALALGLPSALSEDAYGKLAEAYEKAGDKAAACSAYSEYARRYPKSSRTAAALARCQVDAPR